MSSIELSQTWLKLTELSKQTSESNTSIHLSHQNINTHIHSPYTPKSILNLLKALTEESNLKTKIKALFDGYQVAPDNYVHHVLNRNQILQTDNFFSDQFLKMVKLSEKIRKGEWPNLGSETLKTIVLIGIGGSDTGTKFLMSALESFKSTNINFLFVSNLDPNEIEDTLSSLSPDSTFFIVSSKSFTTAETLSNTRIAMQWLNNDSAINKHFVAISADKGRVLRFFNHKISNENILEMSAHITGRFSIWSSILLPIAIAIGESNILKLIQGACEMDQHFIDAPFEKNIPLLLGALDVWHISFKLNNTRAIIPYTKHFKDFIPYICQQYMESLGKNTNNHGQKISYKVGSIIWGGVGSDSQHAFHQFLLQSTYQSPCDIIHFEESECRSKESYSHLLNNVRAQANIIINGLENCNKLPVNQIIVSQIDPYNIGSLLALYEHRLFTQATMWNINAFDQPAVEIGKKLSRQYSQMEEFND